MANDCGAMPLNCFDSPFTEFHENPSKGSMLVMEDLNNLNYEPIEGLRQTFSMNLPHLKLALKELAKFHAYGNK